ncbi:MAG: Fe-S oxidoreductase, partial [Crocinitomicaceae bacterium]|nr:Fe-S oxidoreductase [Crocinitomicaceae bacterium]
MIAQLLFILLLGITGYVAWKRFRFISRNIRLGRKIKPKGPASARWSTMFRIALGQGKMFSRPFAAIMHLFVYAGFIIINIEVLEIVIDGASGTHRVFSFLGGLYNFLIGSFEILALLVLVACLTFLLRRNVASIARFHSREMTKWPRNDANIILVTEILLMTAFLIMNTADHQLQ